MIIFAVVATLREERLLLEKKYIYVCIFLLRVAPDFYSQQSREQYLDKFIDSYIQSCKCTYNRNQRAEEQSAGPRS